MEHGPPGEGLPPAQPSFLGRVVIGSGLNPVFFIGHLQLADTALVLEAVRS